MRWLVLGILTALLATPTVWALEPKIDTLSSLDQQFMQRQRDEVDSLARRYLGERLRNAPESDLAILQELLDKRLVKHDEVETLQAMGVVLGDLLARSEGLHWVVYIDRRGRSRALEFPVQKEYLFPITMISRRVEAGVEVNVQQLYEQALEIAAEIKRRGPAI